VMWARLCLAQGDFAGAQTALDEVAQITRQVSIDPWIATWADECRVRLWLSMGDLKAALDWVDERDLTLDGAFSYQHDLPHIHLARVLIAAHQANNVPRPQQSLDQVLGLLERLAAAAKEAGWVHEQIEILALQALAMQTLVERRGGPIAPALNALSRALDLAAPGGYLRAFLDHGPPMTRLLHQAAAQNVQPGYVGKLLATAAESFGTCPPEPDPQPETPDALLIEPLSEREIEVLALIAEGLTNRQVGERLYISQGTVKAHTSNIFGKLGVRSRTQAVARARDLSILQ